MGWIVGFEPTYTGATTLCLNHLTIPTILVNFVYCCVAVSFALGCVPEYAPFDSQSTRLALRKTTCVCSLLLILCIATLLLPSISVVYLSTRLSLSVSAPCTPQNYLRMQSFVNFVYCYISAFMLFKKLATWNGLEPSTSSVTGWHSNQLNYQAASCFLKKHGGRYRARTCDPLLVRQVLSQLS